MRLTRRSTTLPLLLLGLVLASSQGWADGPAPVPDVTGKTADEARAALGALGLVVGQVEVAGTPPGTVAAQAPAAGSVLPPGAVVILDVRAQADVATTAPKAVGLTIAEASTAFGGLYDLRFVAGTGADADRGHVVAQAPSPGQPISLHAPFTLTFVPDVSLPATVTVPDVSGLSPSDAAQALAAAGLHARLARAAVPGAPPDVVFGQHPLPGSQAPRYATVDVVVTVAAETPPSGETVTGPVPNVVGMSESSARAAIDAAHLVTVVEWVDGDPAQAFLVQSQDPAADASVPLGSEVHVRLVRYVPPASPGAPSGPAGAVVPDLYGMTEAQAEDLLASLGLVANPIFAANAGVPPLRVFAQQLLPGTPVDPGTLVAFRVSIPPPPPAPVPVPSLFGTTKGQALALASQAGLSLSIQEVVTSAWPPHRIFSQSISPWSQVPLGTVVGVSLARPPAGPALRTVPDLTGRTVGQAQFLLATAGLAGNAVDVWTLAHPPFRVFAQSIAPGTSVPVGSTVGYEVAKPAFNVRKVPDLGGLTKFQAVAAVQAAGLVPQPQDVYAPGNPPGKVFWQDPAPNALRLAGAPVAFRVAKVLTALVPDLTGKTGPQAMLALQAAGLVGSGSQGYSPGQPLGRVYDQNPGAGAFVAPGTVVHFVVQGLPGAMVAVPNVYGMTKAAASAALQAVGLNPQSVAVFNLARPWGTVFDQSPAAGAGVLSGTTVTLKIATNVPPAILTTVPNLLGLTPAQAATALSAAGLGSNGKKVPVLFKPHGRVYSQDKPAGAHVLAGTVVTWRWNP